MRTRSLPGSFRARTSLRTRPDAVVGRLAVSAAIACRENWTVMIVFRSIFHVRLHKFVPLGWLINAGAGASVQLRSRSGCCGQRLAVATSEGRPTRDLALTWTPDGESIVEHIAGVEDYQVALATFRAACERWPGRLLATK